MNASKLNKNKVLGMIINDYQARQIKELLERASNVNKTITVKLEVSENGCNWTNALIVFKNTQVSPYLPKSIMMSFDVVNDIECEFTFNLSSVLSKF